MRSKRANRAGAIGLLQGTLDMMILRTLERGPQHGHGIGVAIRAGSEEFLHIERGSLYPALHRLEGQGWIDAEWRMSEHNQRAKYLSPDPRWQEAAGPGGVSLGTDGGSHRPRDAACLMFFRRRRAERDLDDEIRFDVAEESRRLRARGETPDAASASARRGFGSVIRIKEQTREAWGWAGAERLVQDLRFAIRTVRASPGFSLAVVLTLAVGLGLCSFLFNTLDALLLRPLPGARQPAQLVATQNPVAFAYFERYRGPDDVATAAAAYIGPVPFNVALANGDVAASERIAGHLVSLEYFSTLGTRPLLGRFFDRDRERRGGPSTAVISEHFWRTRLAAAADAIGREIWINRQPTTIIGVAEQDFQGLFPMTPADIFVPVTVDPAVAPELAGGSLENPASRLFRVVLRLAPGMDIKAAEAALDARTRQLDDIYGYRPPDHENVLPRARLISAATVAPYPPQLRSLVVVFFSAMTTLILTFACANLAGLVLARASARRHEVALRLALGVGRARMVRQLLAESVVLAVAGGAGGSPLPMASSGC